MFWRKWNTSSKTIENLHLECQLLFIPGRYYFSIVLQDKMNSVAFIILLVTTFYVVVVHGSKGSADDVKFSAVNSYTSADRSVSNPLVENRVDVYVGDVEQSNVLIRSKRACWFGKTSCPVV